MKASTFVVIGVLLTASLGLPGGAPDPSAGDGVARADGPANATTAPAPDSLADEALAPSENVSVDVSVRWSNASPDTVAYELTFTGTPSSEFELVVDEDVESVTGFAQDGDGTWEYDADADAHRIVVRQSVAESASNHDWVYSSDSGVLVGPPGVQVRWVDDGVRYTENPLVHDYANVDVSYGNHSGFREYRRIYVGAHTTYSATHNGSTYTVFVPQLADGDDYERIVRSLASHGDYVPVDDGVAHAEFVVFPDGESSNPNVSTYAASASAARTYSGAPESIVEDDVRWNSYDNPYAHEYTHIEAEWWGKSKNSWLREAQAEYLTAMNMHRVGCSDGDLDGFLRAEAGTRDDVLSDPSTWRPTTPYEKGVAVTSDFSARLARQSGGATTMTDVFAAMEDRTIDTHGDFLDAVNRTVDDARLNEANRRYLDRYVGSSDYPSDVARPPVDRAASCLADYQHVEVTKTVHENGS